MVSDLAVQICERFPGGLRLIDGDGLSLFHHTTLKCAYITNLMALAVVLNNPV